MFEKLEGFNLPVSDDKKLFKNLAIFDFESICLPIEELKETQTTTWIGKHVPISVSISSNLIDEPIFLYNMDPQNLIIDFASNLELLAEKSKLEMRTNFQDSEVAVNERMKKIFDQLNERGQNFSSNKFEYEDECIEDSEEAGMSTQFLRIQKNQLIDLKQHLERYINTLPVFGFNSGRYDLNLIKSYLIPYLIRDKEPETSVIKKANDFISFKFGDVQFLDIMKFLGGATTLDSFLKAYKASETKGFFPYEWFDNPDKLDFPGLPPYEAFFSKLRNNNPLDKDFTDYEKMRKSGLDEQQALKKLQLKTVPPSGLDNYSYLQQTWQKNGMTVFKDFLPWYNNKDVVPNLETMQKMIQFYHNKGIDMLKLGCTPPNLANICLYRSTNNKFYPFCENDKDLCEKIREGMTGGPSIVFTRKAVVHTKPLSEIHQIFVSQSLELMRASFTPIQCVKKCQQDCIRDGNLTLICRNSRLDIIELATLRIWSCLSIMNQDQNVKMRAFLHLENRRKLTVLMWTVIVITVKQYSRQWDATITFVLVKKLVPP